MTKIFQVVISEISQLTQLKVSEIRTQEELHRFYPQRENTLNRKIRIII